MFTKSLNYSLTKKSYTFEYSAKLELNLMTDNFTFLKRVTV